MSLIIKYMEMPQNCKDCPFYGDIFIDAGGEPEIDDGSGYSSICSAMTYKVYEEDRTIEHYEDEDGEWIDFDIKSGRHPDCPLRERKGNKEEEE